MHRRSPHSVKYPKLPGQLCMPRCPGTARLQMHKMPRYGSRRWKDKPGAEPIGWGLKLECRSDPALVRRRFRAPDGDDRRARNVSEATNAGKFGKVGVLSMTRRIACSKYLHRYVVHALQMQIVFMLYICLPKPISLLERRVRLGMIRHAAFSNSARSSHFPSLHLTGQ